MQYLASIEQEATLHIGKYPTFHLKSCGIYNMSHSKFHALSDSERLL